MMQRFLLLFGAIVMTLNAQARYGYWQQHVDYTMSIDFNHETHQFTGKQVLVYTNNSPDTLHKVFYHLYFNAFQPGSMMDVRSRTIADPDRRVGDRIMKLKKNEVGYHKIDVLQQDGKNVPFEVAGTILEVTLNKPILPGGKTTFTMDFHSQVPKQIRRSGRDNKEGVDYSMTQWYPKLCEYDDHGWHANPYIGREFHGVWGNFDVTITIHKKYLLGGTGVLQNRNEIGHGYQDKGVKVKKPKGDKLSWNFKAENVHDFAFAADPDFLHDKVQVKDGPLLHFIYQGDTLVDNWKKLPAYASECFRIMNKTFGKYPYTDYSIIQGGDGGMEYPMATLIASHGSLRALVSVTVHEAIHSWYQGVLATDESRFPWMDEGFTTYAQYFVLDKLYNRKASNPHARAYGAYADLALSGKQEPLTTHADHYHLNRTYGISSYNKGAVTLHQLSYIVGEKNFFRGMRTYYNTWKFKHPTVDDFKRVMEKESGLELDWYFEQWVGTTNTIDYGIKHIVSKEGKTAVTIERVGKMPMPLEVVVKLTSGEITNYYIPLRVMRGQKAETEFGQAMKLQSDWPWVYPEYELVINHPAENIEVIVIDPTGRLADINSENDVWPHNESVKFKGE